MFLAGVIGLAAGFSIHKHCRDHVGFVLDCHLPAEVVARPGGGYHYRGIAFGISDGTGHDSARFLMGYQDGYLGYNRHVTMQNDPEYLRAYLIGQADRRNES